MQSKVVLVNEKDEAIGSGEKVEVHRSGKLHRAFSVFIFNSKKELLLQKRAKSKYHSGGLWTNSCCSHPRPGEEILQVAQKRLKEEMGFECDNLKEIFSFVYKVKLDNNLFEHEFDHVLIGIFDGNPDPNKEEVEDWKWVDLQELQENLKQNPQNYTYWFKTIIKKVISYVQSK